MPTVRKRGLLWEQSRAMAGGDRRATDGWNAPGPAIKDLATLDECNVSVIDRRLAAAFM